VYVILYVFLGVLWQYCGVFLCVFVVCYLMFSVLVVSTLIHTIVAARH
jgi:hypothetical protein